MSTEMQLFQFESAEVRMLQSDGETWWVAKDVCEALELTTPEVALRRLDEDEKGTYTIRTLGGDQKMLCVTESGLYHLIFTSRKEIAKVFRRWVTDEVLPSIRKTGSYSLSMNGNSTAVIHVQQLVDAPEECMGCHRVDTCGYRKTRTFKGYLCKNCDLALFEYVNRDFRSGKEIVDPTQPDYEAWVESHKGPKPIMKGLKPWLCDAITKGLITLNSGGHYVVLTTYGRNAISATLVTR